MKIKIRKKHIKTIALIVPVVSLILSVFLCFKVSSFLKQSLDEKFSNWRDKGYDISFDKIEYTTLFPFGGVKILKPYIKAPMLYGDWELFLDEITISTSPFNTTSFDISVKGEQKARYKDKYFDLDLSEIRFNIKQPYNRPLEYLSIHISNAKLPKDSFINGAKVEIRRLKQKETDVFNPSYLVNFYSSNIRLPMDFSLPTNIKKRLLICTDTLMVALKY